MLRQKQATLLDSVYLAVSNNMGTLAAEDLLLSLFDADAVTRVNIGKFFSSFLEKDAYFETHLSTNALWLDHLTNTLMVDLKVKYEEVGSWKLT